jgi:acyl transferase domain-containing protein
MYALHLAVNGLRNGDCDGAIVAGSNIILEPASQIFIAKLGAISPTSVSHTFDASADGYARADGFGSLYLMPLARALVGGHNIRAVIRGSAISAYVYWCLNFMIEFTENLAEMVGQMAFLTQAQSLKRL